jgi:REP element-mobilizing transposase RayT
MSFVKVMIHAVWATKSRYPFLIDNIKQKVIDHIKQNSITKQIYIDTINGSDDHLHCLFALNADLSISKVMQLIKGESAFWINKQELTKTKFEWADEYFAVSVSESIIDKVRTYINNQEDHHKKITFTQEYETFIKQYNFSYHG